MYKEERKLNERLIDTRWLVKSIQAIASESKTLELRYTRDNAELFSYNTADRVARIANRHKDQVLASFDRAGARTPYRCELYPSLYSLKSKKQEQLGIKYDNIDLVDQDDCLQ